MGPSSQPVSRPLATVVCRNDLHHVGWEYRSRQQLFGLPLIHATWGVDPFTGRTRVARGVVAVGPVAMGAVAIGPIAVGMVAAGQVATGVVCALGQLAAAVWSVGQVAIGGAWAL